MDAIKQKIYELAETELKADPTAVWKGLTKVKNMSWRAVL